MNLVLDNPHDIYEKINHELYLLIDNLTSVSTDETLNRSQVDVREKLIGLKSSLKAKLDSLEKNAEWKTFTIAFYGETGAGKSTLIETLRILLNEPTKKVSRDKFKQLQHLYQEKIVLLSSLESELNAISQDLSDLEKKVETLTCTLRAEQTTLTDKFQVEREYLEEQKQAISDKILQDEQRYLSLTQSIIDFQATIANTKVQASWWRKLIHLFKKLPEELECMKALQTLSEVQQEKEQYKKQLISYEQKAEDLVEDYEYKCVELEQKYNQELQPVRREINLVEQTKKIMNQQLVSLNKEIEEELSELKQYSDGDIIGDGRADFTLKTKCYAFSIESRYFNLLDVPGIEGKEGLVLQEIENAVQSAHAVFYVTNKASPPQTGENNRKGTLEKIKEHLGDHTEVWSIFNKKITNPKYALKSLDLLSDDEKESLLEMDNKMIEQLGKHYQGSLSLTALPAFIASTDCFLSDSENYKRREKFLGDFSKQELLEKSQFLHFLEILKNTILLESNNKIKKANLNKANQSLKFTIENLSDIGIMYEVLARKIGDDCDASCQQLKVSFNELNLNLHNKCENLINESVRRARQNIYKTIDLDISNKNFKAVIEKEFKLCVSDVSGSFPKEIGNQIKEFEKTVDDIFKRFSDLSQEFLSSAVKLGEYKFDDKFDIKINMDNGVNITALIGGLIAAVMVPFTAGQSLWLAGAASFTAIASLVKSVWSSFSADYKMSEQRKSTDENLRKLEIEIKSKLKISLQESTASMEKTVQELDMALRSPVQQLTTTIGLFGNSSKKLTLISNKIDKFGDL